MKKIFNLVSHQITSGVSRIKHIRGKRRRVKKNTRYRRLRALDLRLDRRQRERSTIPDSLDDTRRTCSNCGTQYTGRICPQCGQAGTWSRYTWHQAILNLLDIWGLGNRPMFRTLKELFWRPGYMVRDYLAGHRNFYFPPFKLLALCVVFVIFFSWLTRTPMESQFDFEGFIEADPSATDFISIVKNIVAGGLSFLAKNPLYEWLFLGVIGVLCVWISFHRVSNYNLVESYIFLIFIFCIQMICQIPDMLCSGIGKLLNHASAAIGGGSQIVSSVIFDIFGSLQAVITALAIFLSFLAFKQFYGLKWKSTLWHMALLYGTLIVLILCLTVIVSLFSRGEDGMMALLVIALIVGAFLLVHWSMKKQVTHLNKPVIWTSKLSLLPVLLSPAVVIRLYILGRVNIENGIFLSVLLIALFVGLSLLPIVIHRKWNRTWLTLLIQVAVMAIAVIPLLEIVIT